MKRIAAVLASILISVSIFGQNERMVQVGIGASVDCFDLLDGMVLPSVGLGAYSRLGRPDQWVNLMGGVRYIYGTRLSGIQVPILLNVNLLRARQASAYLGAGFEFDFVGSYLGAARFQTGLTGRHIDLYVFYKPYQGDLAAGVTYYF